MSHTLIWEYVVRPDHRREFEMVYGPNGAWATLFSRADGYLGTDLYRHHTDADRYLTVDRWTTRAAFERFSERWRDEYEALDLRCAGYTEREERLSAGF
jgi:heme-degrading monooxygenase HmoA